MAIFIDIHIILCVLFKVTDFILLQETRGNPDGMIVCHLPFGPTAYFTLTNVVMRHEVPDCGTISEEYPHLIFNGLNSRLGLRVSAVNLNSSLPCTFVDED